MTFIFRAILLLSFLGLAFVVVKNRVNNPDMRVRFFEDIEMNKRRARHLGLWLKTRAQQLGNDGSEFVRRLLPVINQFSSSFYSKVNKFSSSLLFEGSKFFSSLGPKIKTGAKAGGHALIRLARKMKAQVISGVNELQKDMKAFEVPRHKEDFLDRLDGKADKETPPSEAPSEPIRHRSLGERMFLRKPTPVPREAAQSTSSLVGEKQVQGFQVTELAHEQIVSVEAEIDRDILEKKEAWLLYAITKNPKNTNFYKKLGRIYLQMNNTDDARNCFEHALKLGSQDPEVRALLSEMRRGM